MKIPAILSTIALLALCACGGTGMVSLTPDPTTGKMVRKTYTKYYDAGVWLLPDHLGISVVVDQLDEYSGKITVYAWNRDQEKHAIKIRDISKRSTKAIIERRELLAVGDERTGVGGR